MQCGPGAEQIEYVAISFRSSCLLEDVREVVSRSKISIYVNARMVQESPLILLPMEPELSGRLICRSGYAVREGDEVTAELFHHPPYTVKGELDIDAELAILGRLESGELARWRQAGNWMFCELPEIDTPSAARQHPAQPKLEPKQ